MATTGVPKTGFEKWQSGINQAAGNPKWDSYDCEIRSSVSQYNHHLAFSTSGYSPLDWRLVKAMIWVESGAESSEWKTRPMQIGVPGDPGLSSFVSGKEGSGLIIPPHLPICLSQNAIASIPTHNIRAGIGYLLMRMASFDYGTSYSTDTKIYEIIVKIGDSLDKIAKENGTTAEVLKKLNSNVTILRPRQILKYKKAKHQKIIIGWRVINTSTIAQRYNGGGDPNYAKKLDFALQIIKNGKEVMCRP